ncbi:hypothetical protein VOLCADRAFT_86070 [Volvox carteri f. nagariensis]|uniref:Uncharacterized protein n=1 Tax=Volvox carteri f. nagariensis TaxID=3068 RepID=D8THS4_VOLCA|nr:uncharacterized protein VOLCADRAFT_86070 [Volvox carteri f. nagariensis]EFJ53117.1 hypothetical protein VOLCADRAFT_86070 [Volvox carteri f. nagariensis]|eukprot:XP_002946122.1 hypothetical protein VOLCADRAFT_86070 [Volvox carteri f. nagariensis]
MAGSGLDHCWLAWPGRLDGSVNIALNKPIYASSVFSAPYAPSMWFTSPLCAIAVDGDKTTIKNQQDGTYATFQSAEGDTTPWIAVDLGAPFLVSRVIIYNRLDCCGSQLWNAEVRIGNMNGGTFGIPLSSNALVWTLSGGSSTGAVHQITISPRVTGRWVTLQNFHPRGWCMQL